MGRAKPQTSMLGSIIAPTGSQRPERLVARNDFRKRLGEDSVAYLLACQAREEAERQEKDERLAAIARANINLLAQVAGFQRLRGNLDSALRLAVHAARLDLGLARYDKFSGACRTGCGVSHSPTGS